MQLTDSIYGKSDISSPIIIELINSKTIQRLKKISQLGLPEEYFHIKGFSRYQHSVGVMLLLKKLGASEEEQITGLLHDISHTAFSHLIDWVEDRIEQEDFQDKNHLNYLLKSDAAKILKKHKLDPLKIANIKNYSLLETEIPHLCADRIDYSIRQFSFVNIKYYLKSLTTYKNKIVFKNKSAARLYALEFLEKQENLWASTDGVWRYYIFYLILKRTLDQKIIKKQDFWQDDQFMLKKIKFAQDKKVNKYTKLLLQKSLKHLPLSNQKVIKKFRYIDPKYLLSGKAYQLSKTDSDYKIMLQIARKNNKRGIILPKID